MKRMKFIHTLLLSVTLGLASCSDYLDPKELSLIEDGDIYKNLNYIQQMWVNSYSYLPNGYSIYYRGGSDEAELIDEQATTQKFNLGNWSKYDSPDNNWDNAYDGIRQCCEIIENLPKVDWEHYKDADPIEYQKRKDLMAAYTNEAIFLKAYYYSELVKRYGGVPLVNKKLSLDKEGDEYFIKNVQRNTFAECVDYIVHQCDSIAPLLPDKYEDIWKGRATKGAALALKARVLLYAASDLYNKAGNTNELVGYTSGNQQDRWLKAAEAASDVINLNQYSLHSSYSALFTLRGNDVSNKEVIFERRVPATNALEKANFSVGYQGNTGACPTQNLVDAYEMADGTVFDWANPAMAANPYSNRDARLKASILVNDETFRGRKVEAWVGGLDGTPRLYASSTGYYMKKHLIENLDIVEDKKETRQWFLFRYAEVLLNYAEAAAQYGGADFKTSGAKYSAKEALDLVRVRAGMPSVDVTFANRGQVLDKTSFINQVLNERRIELSFEDHRWWDVRRTMQGEAALGGKISGVKIIKNPDESFTYTKFDLEQRVFDKNKMYFYPILQTEISKSNNNLKQNPNW